jgi:hypothetical protein
MLEGYELNGLLQEAGIPTELVYFPDESHLFWNPRHQAAAMRRSFEWFDYWLRGERNGDPRKSTQYDRWEAMKENWRRTQDRRP